MEATTALPPEAPPAPADRQAEEVDSLCMNCHERGTTRLLLTRIPYFKDVVLMSFQCPHCGLKNSEIQSAGEIQPRGIKCTFRADSLPDLQRQIVKGDSCVMRIENIDLEIPAGRGQLTNIEGLVTMVRQDLELQQEARKEQQPEVYEKVQEVTTALDEYAQGKKFPFTITVYDPSGNSSIEPATSDYGGKYVKTDFARTSEQNAALGLGTTQEAPDVNIRPEYRATDQMYPAMPALAAGHLNVDEMGTFVEDDDTDILENRVYSFESTCPGCSRPCFTRMKMVNIPHFKQVIIMSTVCHQCGYRANDVKTGGEVPEKGRKITLTVKDKADLSRDILKAESCALQCPELELNVEPGTLGGRFTTVEGLLTQVRDDLTSTIYGDAEQIPGDSMGADRRESWEAFFKKLNDAVNGQLQFTVILQDPLAASYIQSFKAPDPDEQLLVEDYERTYEEMEDLGLNDMVTEGYEQDENEEKKETSQTNSAPGNANSDTTAPAIDVEEIQNELQAQLKDLSGKE